MRNDQQRMSGFTLLEVSVSIAVMVVGVLALSGVVLSVSKQREELKAQSHAAEEAQSMMEIIHGSNPDTVASIYNAQSYQVNCVNTSGSSSVPGLQLTVNTSVDTTNDKLPVVLVETSYEDRGITRSFEYRTAAFAPNGSTYDAASEVDETITWDPDIIEITQ